MKTRLWLLVLVGAVLLSGSAAWADGEFYVVAGGGPPVGTKITSLPANGLTISQPGFYFLGGNLTHSGSGPAITVGADNVTLDLMGFALTRNGLKNVLGVFMNGRTNVEIRNGTISGFNTGIEADSSTSSNHRISNVRANNNNNTGIQLNGDNHVVQGCACLGNGTNGILLLSSGMITGCVAKGNGTGIALQGAGSVIGNFANNNTLFNFVLGTSDTKTEIMVDRNSASGLATNYLIAGTGIVGLAPGTTTNAGAL
jgi:hypothetical protein